MGWEKTSSASRAGSTLFPEAVYLRLPPGWKERIDQAAEKRGMGTSEYLRGIIRRSLARSEGI